MDLGQTLFAPAIVAGILVFLLNQYQQARNTVIRRVHALRCLKVELDVNRRAISQFMPSFYAIERKVTTDTKYNPFIPIDKNSSYRYDKQVDHIFYLSPQALQDLTTYYKRDKHINELLSDISNPGFAKLKVERKQSMLASTRLQLELAERNARDSADSIERTLAALEKGMWIGLLTLGSKVFAKD